MFFSAFAFRYTISGPGTEYMNYSIVLLRVKAVFISCRLHKSRMQRVLTMVHKTELLGLWTVHRPEF
jgi:hypothetical protein